jgi:hypothetical protein
MANTFAYCSECLGLVRLLPGEDPADWVEQCDRCRERDAERAELEAERERQAARWLPRPCAGPGCGNLVIPKKPWAIYCTSACRLRAHRVRAKTAA